MNIRYPSLGIASAGLLVCMLTGPAAAIPVLCANTNLNHMYVDSAYVSQCVDAGIGNINGNPQTDDFLLDNPDLPYTGLGSTSFTQNGTTGTFSLDSSLWNLWDSLAIGFKFGTGNNPDQWFVYLLNADVSSGAWQFVNIFRRGGGLSHVELYGVQPSRQVPEPATIGLLGLGLLGVAWVRRRKTV